MIRNYLSLPVQHLSSEFYWIYNQVNCRLTYPKICKMSRNITNIDKDAHCTFLSAKYRLQQKTIYVGGGGGGGGGGNPKKTKPYPTFLILGLCFFCFLLVFFGLLLGKFWHHFNESRLLFL